MSNFKCKKPEKNESLCGSSEIKFFYFSCQYFLGIFDKPSDIIFLENEDKNIALDLAQSSDKPLKYFVQNSIHTFILSFQLLTLIGSL